MTHKITDLSLDRIISVPYYTGTGDIAYYDKTVKFYSSHRDYYTIPLKDRKRTANPYSARIYTLENHAGTGVTGISSDCTPVEWDNVHAVSAKNQAYAKFKASVSDPSQWAVNLAEGKEAVGMIANRVKQITKFAQSLRKMDLVDAAKQLGIRKPKGLRSSSKDFGNTWLEYHFGWEPLIQDIGAAVRKLSEPTSKRIIRSRASGEYIWESRSDDGYLIARDRVVQSYHFLNQAVVEQTNPPLAQANDLGFVNPISVAWELVPFSFVVDWFTNVGQVLDSATDFLGYTITHSFQSAKGVAVWAKYRSYHDHARDITDHQDSLGTVVDISRQVGPIPGPTLEVPHFDGLGIKRAATAVSLLLQHL